MYIFGGKNFENNKLGDFWAFDFENDSWTELPVPDMEGPISRSGHSSGVYKNFIIIYAGIHELTQELSDMYIYDINRKHWTLVFEEEHSPVHNKSPTSSFSQTGKNYLTALEIHHMLI